jgi:DNA polymerase-3 subunit gamma/tau
MENFIVSARKYRPATFDTVVGQTSITSTLKNAIKNQHLAQAFLFCGPRGVGKTTCARILAKTINCMNLGENLEACNECESCLSFNKSASFNIHELDAASNNSVDDIRTLVEQVRIPPQVGKFKIYIIDEVHMLSPQAFNAFLKTLEEPPDYAKFILATTEKHKIIPTILSRCQIYDFKRITIDDIAKHLAFVAGEEDISFEPDALHIIAQKADGALRDALSIFDQIVTFGGNNITYKNVIENLNVLDYGYYFKITDAIIQHDIKDTLLIINNIFDNGFDGQHFLIGFGEHLRNLLVTKDKETLKLLEVGVEIKKRYFEQSNESPVSFLLKALDINNKCDINYKNSNNKKLHIELALLQMCSLNATNELKEAEFQRISNLEKGKESPSPQKVKDISQEEKTEKKESAKKPASKTSHRTISIKTGVKEVKKDEEEDLSNKPVDEFSQQQLEEAWEKLADKNKNSGNLFSALSKRTPQLKNGFVIEQMVDNKILENIISENKIDLLGFVRKELNNYQIQIEVVINENPSNDKPYTPEDKFNFMAKKNPEIINLKDQLDLYPDY